MRIKNYKIFKSFKGIYYEYLLVRTLLRPIKFFRRLYQKLIFKVKINTVNNIREMICDDIKLNVREFNGVFVMNSQSDLFERLVLEGKYEPELVEYCKQLLDKERDVIDVGANIGFFTVMFAKKINNNKKVLSIEPTKKALCRLKKNIELNEVNNKVVVFEGVATNNNENVEVKTILGKEEYSSIGEMAHAAILNEKYLTEKVQGLTIDELVEINEIDPGFIKVDVEGCEHLVFQGAYNVLKNNRPIILSELSDYLLRKNSTSAKDVIDIIKQFNYTIIDPINPNVTPGKKEYGDILCIPNEKIDEINIPNLTLN